MGPDWWWSEGGGQITSDEGDDLGELKVHKAELKITVRY